MKIIERGLDVLHEQGLRMFMKRTASYGCRRFVRVFTEATGLGYALVPVVAQRFRKSADEIKSIDEAVDFAFSFRYLGVSIVPRQVKNEIVELLRLIRRMKPRVVLEIGTAKGGTLFLFCQCSDPEAIIISIDLRSGLLDDGYAKWRTLLYKQFAKDRQELHLIRTDSHSPDTFQHIANLLGDKKIDFCFIDGDHTYDGVRKDFETYSRLVGKRGIVAFHDILGQESHFSQVERFWKEIKLSHRYSCHEIVYDDGELIPRTTLHGIGVVHL